MFKKSVKHTQGDLFCAVPSILQGKSLNQYNNQDGWHNQFREHVFSRIDESVFKVLFDQRMGAPNASVCLLVSMMILKEAFGWSDSQLFENCRFNLLVRSALGLFNLNDEVPTDSTYYLFRQRMFQYNRQHQEDLMQKTFELITGDQIRDFQVNGKSIRMDSKLIGSNIAFYSRYEIIHQSLVLFYRSLKGIDLSLFDEQEREQVKSLLEEEPGKTVYRSSKDEIQKRMQQMGHLIHKTLRIFSPNPGEPYLVLDRVFNEQYKLTGQDHQIELRQREEISSGSVQSPHDPDGTYCHKKDQKVKGYRINVTETVTKDQLNLVTSVIVDKANVPDMIFVKPAVEATKRVTAAEVERVYADGAFQSPLNDEYCRDMEMIFTGIQGSVSRFDLQMKGECLWVTDSQTGKCYQGVLAKKRKNSTQDTWVIHTQTRERFYFSQQAIRASEMRRKMNQLPVEESHKRNNVEATIHHLAYTLAKGKSRYRREIKIRTWAICRCLWINLVRIVNFVEQTCQRTSPKGRKAALLFNYRTVSIFMEAFYKKLNPQLSLFTIFYLSVNINQF